MPRYILPLVFFLMFTLPLAAVAGDSSPAYNFLNLPSSTTAYGLGGINITNISDDINNIDQNPALLGPEIESQVGINYMRYIGESNFAGIKYGKAAGEHSAWAVGIQYLNYGEIKAADSQGNITGSFSPKDVLFNGIYSRDINDRWRGGINLKFAYSNYEQYSAMAIATDIGVNYYDPDRDLSFSIVAANLGGQIKRFNDSYDRLPIDLRIGWAQSFSGLPIRFSITAWNLTKWKLPYYETGDGIESNELKQKESFSSNLFRHLIFGAEFIPSDNLSICLGYNYKTRTDMSTYNRNFISGFSLGAQLKVKAFGVGVAIAQPHTGATTIMLNLSANISQFIY